MNNYNDDNDDLFDQYPGIMPSYAQKLKMEKLQMKKEKLQIKKKKHQTEKQNTKN